MSLNKQRGVITKDNEIDITNHVNYNPVFETSIEEAYSNSISEDLKQLFKHDINPTK